MEVYIVADSPPTAVHSPASIPIHWRDQVKEELDRDCMLGVIEKVPPNTPVTWCHRAFWTSKSDGTVVPGESLISRL